MYYVIHLMYSELSGASASTGKHDAGCGRSIALRRADMPNQQDKANLQNFVDASKSKGASDEFLAALLTRRGWPADDVYAALGKFWEGATGLPVPQRAGSGESSRDAFLYLLAFATLATWITELGSMLFQFIDHWLPDPVTIGYTPDLRSTLTWEMASIAVAFPVFLVVMRVIFREAANNPERLQSGVRKWLTWIALLLTAGAMIGDLITFLAFFLMGELSARFVLKSATVIVLAGAVFAYYVASLRWDASTDVALERKRGIAFGAVGAAAVITAFCVGLGLAGVPSQQRHIEADRTRVQDLRNIAFAVKSSYTQRQALPASLAALRIRHKADPETGAPYEYHLTSETKYDLCATFAMSEMSDPSAFWSHAAGRSCFPLDATTQIPW